MKNIFYLINFEVKNALFSFKKCFFILIFILVNIGLSIPYVIQPPGSDSIAFIGLLKIILALILRYTFINQVNNHVVSGKIKNYMLNNFSKQQYILSYLFLNIFVLFISSLLSTFAMNIAAVLSDDNHFYAYSAAEFCVFYLNVYFSSIIISAFTFSLFYFWFNQGIDASTFLKILLCLIFTFVVLDFILISLSTNQVNWFNFLLVSIPYVNLLYFMPKMQSLLGFSIYWILLSNSIFTFSYGLLFWKFTKSKNYYFINNQAIKKWFF